MKKSAGLLLFIIVTIILNAQEGNEIRPFKVLKKQNGGITALAFSPDGKTLATGSADKTIALWSTITWENPKILNGHTNTVNALAYLPTGTRLYSGGDFTLRSWKAGGEAENTFRGPTTYIWSIAVKPDSSQAVSGSYEKNIKLYDLRTGKSGNIAGHAKSVLAVCYSPDGKLMASGSLDEKIILWETSAYKPVDTLVGHGGNIYCLTFSSDGKYLASTSNDNTIRIWEMPGGRMVRVLQGHTNGVLSAAFSPDGNYLVSGGIDTKIRVWEICNGESLADISFHTDVVNKVAFHPSGDYFVSVSNDKTTALWNFSPKLIAEHYFTNDLKKEREQSGLFVPKGKEESKTDYQARQVKANAFDKQLIEKYYGKYVSSIKGVWK